MNLSDYSLYIEALSSCAIEGNVFAIKLLKLRETNPSKFIKELEKLSQRTKKEDE